jgi:hypothetical protein
MRVRAFAALGRLWHIPSVVNLPNVRPVSKTDLPNPYGGPRATGAVSYGYSAAT